MQIKSLEKFFTYETHCICHKLQETLCTSRNIPEILSLAKRTSVTVTWFTKQPGWGIIYYIIISKSCMVFFIDFATLQGTITVYYTGLSLSSHLPAPQSISLKDITFSRTDCNTGRRSYHPTIPSQVYHYMHILVYFISQCYSKRLNFFYSV